MKISEKRKMEKLERGKIKYESREFFSEARVDDKYFYRYCISPRLVLACATPRVLLKGNA